MQKTRQLRNAPVARTRHWKEPTIYRHLYERFGAAQYPHARRLANEILRSRPTLADDVDALTDEIRSRMTVEAAARTAYAAQVRKDGKPAPPPGFYIGGGSS